MKRRVLSIAESEVMEAACGHDDQSSGLGELFLAEYAAALSAIEVAPLRFGPLETAPAGRFRRRILRRFPYPLMNLLGVEPIEGIRPTPIGSEESVAWPRLDE